MTDLIKLTEQLSKFGIVEVIKNDYVFTLYMVRGNISADKIGQSLDKILTPLKVLETVTSTITDKPIIEVFKNDSNFILLVLKPKK